MRPPADACRGRTGASQLGLWVMPGVSSRRTLRAPTRHPSTEPPSPPFLHIRPLVRKHVLSARAAPCALRPQRSHVSPPSFFASPCRPMDFAS